MAYFTYFQIKGLLFLQNNRKGRAGRLLALQLHGISPPRIGSHAWPLPHCPQGTSTPFGLRRPRSALITYLSVVLITLGTATTPASFGTCNPASAAATPNGESPLWRTTYLPGLAERKMCCRLPSVAPLLQFNAAGRVCCQEPGPPENAGQGAPRRRRGESRLASCSGERLNK